MEVNNINNIINKSNINIIDSIINIINNLKGKNIININISKISNITDYMIICTGMSNKHTISIMNGIIYKSSILGIQIFCISGQNTAEWIIIDLNDIMIHIMQEQIRKLYDLEKLWNYQ